MGFETKEEIDLLELFEERLDVNPQDVEALIGKGFLLGVTPFFEPEEAKNSLELAIKLDPTNVGAYFWLAKTLYHSMGKQGVKDVLEKALSVDPGRADCLTLLVDLEDDPDKSISHLKRALKLEPSWTRPKIVLAYYLLDKNDLNGVEQILKEVLNLAENTRRRKPAGPINTYYEGNVTGRTCNHKEDIDRLLSMIKEVRAKDEKK